VRKTAGTKTDFDMNDETAIQGHSSSFILQSVIQTTTDCLSPYM